ncbi:MAG: hypothetical protein FJY34_05950 [Betaproteobacteria bacterium]|nr:hypothetical protein [Betaproteobacteria bacterium]
MHRHEVLIPAAKVSLTGTATLPEGASGIVAFAHGSGSSRHSPRNQYVASVLHQHGIATQLFDLLTRRRTATTKRASTSICSPNACSPPSPGWRTTRKRRA